MVFRPATARCWWLSTWGCSSSLWTASAERPEDIDKNRAEAARIRAEERLQHKQSMHEYYQTKIALDRAMQRLQTAAKYKR